MILNSKSIFQLNFSEQARWDSVFCGVGVTSGAILFAYDPSYNINKTSCMAALDQNNRSN